MFCCQAVSNPPFLQVAKDIHFDRIPAESILCPQINRFSIPDRLYFLAIFSHKPCHLPVFRLN